MSVFNALVSGFVGACAVTLINETVRQFVKDAPRLDILGKRAIAYPLMEADIELPPNSRLYWYTLGSDLAANSLYYSLVGLGDRKNAMRNGAILGLVAGLGAVALPEPLGLGEEMTARTRETQLMTIAWYLAGGLAAAAAFQSLPEDSEIYRANESREIRFND